MQHTETEEGGPGNICGCKLCLIIIGHFPYHHPQSEVEKAVAAVCAQGVDPGMRSLWVGAILSHGFDKGSCEGTTH